MDQRSYGITVKEKYDSPEFKNAEENIIVDVPVKQYSRLSTSNIDVMPDSMAVGSESNVMFGINNTGKVVLYNVTVSFEGDSIKPVDTCVGNIKPGETGIALVHQMTEPFTSISIMKMRTARRQNL